jgi:5-formyltetrahydrofolate cyclo-ligase
LKTNLRLQLREKLRQLGDAPLKEVGHQVKQLLPDLIRTRPGVVAIYWPLLGEPDLRPLGQGSINLALPRSASEGLEFLNWHSSSPLCKDICGIPAPLAGKPLDADQVALMLVPALAIDQGGIRLGSGGGWYDRLRAMGPWRKVPALVVVPQACLRHKLPRDPWDIPFDGWITEEGLSWRQV